MDEQEEEEEEEGEGCGGGGFNVIDMGDFPRQSQKLVRACEEWGCFRVINHRIPIELLSNMKSVVRSLVDRPIEIKRRNEDVTSGRGYIAPTEENPLYEGFGFYDVVSSVAVETFCAQLDASSEEREIIKTYCAALYELMMELKEKLAEAMGMGSVLCDGWPCEFRINKYNFTEETVGSPGVCIHTDPSFLTILQDDDCVGGLEVMDTFGEYITVDHWPGTLVVNIGDVATAWSNGRFRNVKHRVQCKEADVRVSIALFLLGPKEEAVEAPPEFVDSDHPRLYSPIMYEEYRNQRASTRLRAGEVLELLRLTPS